MTGTFTERIDELRKLVGCGKIIASCTVDQRYAAYQHEHVEFRHPRGGKALYLQQPLYEHYSEYVEDYAKTVLEDGGHGAMKRTAEHLSDQVEEHAPREFDDLRRSGHPQVTVNGEITYDRPPKLARLTEAQLKAKCRISMARRWDAVRPCSGPRAAARAGRSCTSRRGGKQ